MPSEMPSDIVEHVFVPAYTSEISVCPTCLPLEIQERIIFLGAEKNPDRTVFLCLCALVCRAWVPTSRSSLQLLVGTKPRVISVQSLVLNPMMTIAHSISTMRINDPETMAALPHLPSIHTLSLDGSAVLRDSGWSDSHPVAIRNVHSLALTNMVIDSVAEIHAIFSSFPFLEHLKLAHVTLKCLDDPSLHGPNGLSLMLSSLQVRVSSRRDIDVLDWLFCASPNIHRIVLRPSRGAITPLMAEWVSRSLRGARSNIHLTLKPTTDEQLADYYLYHDTLKILLAGVHSFVLPSPLTDEIEDSLPKFIRLSPQLISVVISGASMDTMAGCDLGELSQSLLAAQHVRTVHFPKCGLGYAWLDAVTVLAHPHLSLFVQMDDSTECVEIRPSLAVETASE